MTSDTCPPIDFERFFKPRSIAIIGASSEPSKIGHKLLANIVHGGFVGEVYPINPKGGTIEGLEVKRSLDEIPGPVDLALISIPAPMVKGALIECGKAGIPYVIIVSAGFSEVGRYEEEKELVDIARKYDIRFLGPNVLGIIFTPSDLNAQFGPRELKKGGVGIISQSGMLGSALLNRVVQEEIGVSGLVSTGNKADIGDEEILSFFCTDPNTDVILMYIEGLKDGRSFLDSVSRVSRVKPVIILKSGRSQAGANAVRSHTASLAGEDRIFDGAFKQAGALRADNMRQALEWTRALMDLPLPDDEDKGALVITNGGGFGVLAVDRLEREGLKLFKDQKWIEEKLGPIFPDYAVLSNPVDMTAQVGWEEYIRCLESALEEPGIGSLLGIFSPTSGVDIQPFTNALVERVGNPKKPMVLCTIGTGASTQQIDDLNRAGLPAFYYPEDAVSALASTYHQKRVSDRLSTENLSSEAWDLTSIEDLIEGDKNGFLDIETSFNILRKGPILIAEYLVASNLGDAYEKADEIGYPVVMKTVSENAVHKTDVGGVRTHISCREELENAYYELKVISSRVMIMEQLEGVEIIAGCVRDTVFGPVVMLGMGGIMVEALEKVSFRPYPITEHDVEDMLEEAGLEKLKKGFRGKAGIDLKQLTAALDTLGKLLLDRSDIDEIELNPIFVTEQGLKTADCRIGIDRIPK